MGLKTMCPPNYHDNGFVGTHALGYNRLLIGHLTGNLFLIGLLIGFNATVTL